MCGIGGIWTARSNQPRISRFLKGAAQHLQHRGPDGERFWINPDATLGFCHTRLSILEMSQKQSLLPPQ